MHLQDERFYFLGGDNQSFKGGSQGLTNGIKVDS